MEHKATQSDIRHITTVVLGINLIWESQVCTYSFLLRFMTNTTEKQPLNFTKNIAILTSLSNLSFLHSPPLSHNYLHYILTPINASMSSLYKYSHKTSPNTHIYKFSFTRFFFFFFFFTHPQILLLFLLTHRFFFLLFFFSYFFFSLTLKFYLILFHSTLIPFLFFVLHLLHSFQYTLFFLLNIFFSILFIAPTPQL